MKFQDAHATLAKYLSIEWTLPQELILDCSLSFTPVRDTILTITQFGFRYYQILKGSFFFSLPGLAICDPVMTAHMMMYAAAIMPLIEA